MQSIRREVVVNSPLNDQQLVWRCRRGIRELDVLFGRYLKLVYVELSDEGKIAFAHFLDVQDPLIMDWLFQRNKPEQDEFLPILQSLRELSGLSG